MISQCQGDVKMFLLERKIVEELEGPLKIRTLLSTKKHSLHLFEKLLMKNLGNKKNKEQTSQSQILTSRSKS